ncbi:unnamed protein product [Tuber aestivum]|uniref:Uncharacterized protein n=1 Tax=Tuber aestivum TaxID=59557 RepID=A0A292PUD0_9PEZI|nr:unnamed protein product [Tuber aestivum]
MPEPLGACRFLHRRNKPGFIRQQTSMSNHNPIIDAKPLIRSINIPTSIPSHQPHHLLQALVAPNPTNNKNLLATNVRHSPLRYLNKHSEYRLLQGETKILAGDWLTLRRELDKVLAFFGHLLDVVARRWVVGDVEGSGEAVETVSDGYVEGFTEYSVSVVEFGC